MRSLTLVSALLLSAGTVIAQDTVLYQRDSVIEIGSECREGFFVENERVADPKKIYVRNSSGRQTTLARFMEVNNIGGFSESVLADLDSNGSKELLLSNFTGGAHCCDEIYVFQNTAPGRFRLVGKTFAGHVCFLPGNRLRFSFYESFGYFFTCYACSFPDTSETAPIPVGYADLRYRNGRLEVVPGDKTLGSLIRDNLDKLSEEPYEEMGETSQDNGLRKEFALNLAVYYYSFGKNLPATKKLFDTYYRFPDAAVVWKEFVRVLGEVKRKNSF